MGECVQVRLLKQGDLSDIVSKGGKTKCDK